MFTLFNRMLFIIFRCAVFALALLQLNRLMAAGVGEGRAEAPPDAACAVQFIVHTNAIVFRVLSARRSALYRLRGLTRSRAAPSARRKIIIMIFD